MDNWRKISNETNKINDVNKNDTKNTTNDVEKKALAWFNKNALRILNLKVQNSLYNHPGRFDESMMVGQKLKEYEDNRQNNNYNDFSIVPNSILSTYPYNLFFGTNNANGSNIDYNLDILNIINQIKDNLICFFSPFFYNYLRPVINNVVGGCKKGTINCRFVNAPEDKTENAFFENELNNKISEINENWTPKIQAIQQKIQELSEIYKNTTNPEVANEIKRNEDLLNTLQLGYQKQIQFSQMAFELVRKKHNNLMKDIRIIGDKCAEIINLTLNDEENYENIFNALKTSLTAGISVIKFSFDEEKKIYIENINRPETCFFDTRAKKSDRSDGRYCGMVYFDSKYNLKDKYNLTDEEIANLINFSPQNVSEYFFFASTYDIKDFVIICEYYEKINDKIYKSVCCKNRFFEEKTEIKSLNGLLPLLMVDSNHAQEYKVDTILQDFFAEQKSLNAEAFKLMKQKLNSSSGKIGFQVDDIDGETANQIRNQTCQDLGYVLISNTSSAIDVQSVPISLEGTHLDPYFTQSFESNRQNFLNKIDKYILNNQINNSQTNQLGVLSGTAIENNQINRENILANKIEIILKILKKFLRKTVILNFVEIFSNSDYEFSPIDKMMQERIKEQQDTIKKMLCNISFDLDWIIDNSIRRNKALQTLKETLQIIPQDNPAIKPIIYEIIQNLDLPNGSNVIVELMEEASRQPKDPNPADQLKAQELQLTAQQMETNNQIKMMEMKANNDNKQAELNIKSELEDRKNKLDLIKHKDNIELERRKIELQAELGLATNLIIHHNNATQSEISQALKLGKKFVENE